MPSSGIAGEVAEELFGRTAELQRNLSTAFPDSFRPASRRPVGLEIMRQPAVPWAFSPRTRSVGKAGTYLSAARATERWTPAAAGEACHIVRYHEASVFLAPLAGAAASS